MSQSRLADGAAFWDGLAGRTFDLISKNSTKEGTEFATFVTSQVGFHVSE